MNLYQVVVCILLCGWVMGGWTNTTQFWKDTLKTDTIHYQCYSGMNTYIKVMKKSIGTIPKEHPACIIVCLPRILTDPTKLMPEYH